MAGTLPLRPLRQLLVPSLVTLALVTGACAGSGTGSRARSGARGDQAALAPVSGLTSIDTLRDAFNQGAGSTRLILLVSPT